VATDKSAFFLHTSLLSAMLGASIGFAIQSGLSDPSAWTLVAIVFLVLHAVNFYHGKTVGLHDVNELIRTDARPVVRGTLLLYNTSLFLTFCVMAARVEDPFYIVWGEVAVRVLDIIGVAAQLRWGDRSPGRRRIGEVVRRQLHYWQTMNITFLVIFIGLAWGLPRLQEAWRYPIVVSVLVVMVAIDLVLDYTMYSGNYFRRLGDWDALAERWDRLQGRYGDSFRSAIIHPFVEAWLLEAGATRAVDLGSGNGCTARWLAERRGLPVLGLEVAERLVDIANLYPVEEPAPAIQYQVASIDARDNRQLVDHVARFRGDTDAPMAFVSLFGAQDCASLDTFFRNVSRLMRPGERLLVVYETAESFDPSERHTSTVRTWKYSWRLSERLQVVSWLPVRHTNPTSVYAGGGSFDSEDVISTVTHFRTPEDYEKNALAVGLEKVRSGTIRLEDRPSTPSELEYTRVPRFGYLDFVVQATAEESGTGILASGAAGRSGP
jgi:SAM-dependent methyltransferase